MRKKKRPYFWKYRGPRRRSRGYKEPKLVDFIKKYPAHSFHDDLVDATAYAMKLLSLPNDFMKELP